MRWEPSGSGRQQGSAPHTHTREQDRPTDGGPVQPRVLVLRKYHGDEDCPSVSFYLPVSEELDKYLQQKYCLILKNFH
ncbi:hypothetical protein AV530_016464 [Patagioenas fasciata monilis]|uniref:Uncharacterized protein n=1 Tax=Patagioenas fasciata monilis TaxID=372326 RepID=A0A1V4J3R1_PATFA|nr:hypothetical protein AV530_016464 [Patagioenas fasciata monilis]